MTTTADIDNVSDRGILARCRAALGNLKATCGPEIALDLDDQIDALVEWATGSRPDFRRTIPVSPRDHDVLICAALVRLVELAERLADAPVDPAAAARVRRFVDEWAARPQTSGTIYSLGTLDGTLDLTVDDLRALAACK